jgi:hypothetical protein
MEKYGPRYIEDVPMSVQRKLNDEPRRGTGRPINAPSASRRLTNL